MTHSPDYTDALLLQGLANGDEKIFEVIYRKYAGELFRYVARTIYNKEDCEEIIQEVFESLWTRRRDLRIESTLRAYLYGMVRYKIIHYIKKSVVRKKYAEHFALFEAVYTQAAEEVDGQALQSTLENVIKELPERCQMALKLRLTEELSNKDIARRMNVTTRTVETYIYRAFNYIRESYKVHAGKT